ncbi:VCBS domain-containing protein, partial [Vibrio sp. E150_011]
MGFAVFLGLASITGTLVLDKKGQLKVLAEGMALQEGDVVLSVIDGQSTNELVGVDIIGESGQIIQSAQFSQSDEQSAADIIAQIEAGQDPTQNEEQAAAAGENLSSSITTAATVEVTHDQVLAATFFETRGLARDSLTPTQYQTLLNVLTNSAPVTVFDSRTFDEESLDGELNLSFPSDPNNDTLVLTITELPRLGTVTLSDGTPVELGQVLSESEFENLQFDAPQEYTLGEDAGQISYTVDDGQGADNSVQTGGVSLTINPINDVPEIIEVGSGLLVESGNLDDGSLVDGVSTASGKIEATDNDTDATLTFGVQDATNDYGTFSIDASTGEWVFTLDNDAPATQALKEGVTVETSFVILVTDDQGAQVTQTLPITIQGTNDAPTFDAGGDAAGSVTEQGDEIGGESVATGLVAASDIDDDAVLIYQVESAQTEYGSFSVDEQGKWQFTLDNDAAVTQALKEGETKALDYVISVTDEFGAQNTQTVSISINGTNDKPVVTDSRGTSGAVNEAGNEDDGSVVPGKVSDTGIIRASDSDSELTFTTESTSPYGDFTINESNGLWQFTLDNAASEVQALKEGETIEVVYNVQITDDQGAFITQPVTIEIFGTNDQPTFHATSDLEGTLVEAGTNSLGVSKASGTLLADDVDADAALTFFVEDGASDYGQLVVLPDGRWSFTLNNDLPSTQALKSGESVEIEFPVVVRDEFAAVSKETLIITIVGTNDAPVITGTSAGQVIEDNTDDIDSTTGDLTVGAKVDISDVDQEESVFKTDVTAGADNFADGELVIDENGNWTFTIPNTDPLVQGL